MQCASTAMQHSRHPDMAAPSRDLRRCRRSATMAVCLFVCKPGGAPYGRYTMPIGLPLDSSGVFQLPPPTHTRAPGPTTHTYTTTITHTPQRCLCLPPALQLHPPPPAVIHLPVLLSGSGWPDCPRSSDSTAGWITISGSQRAGSYSYKAAHTQRAKRE